MGGKYPNPGFILALVVMCAVCAGSYAGNLTKGNVQMEKSQLAEPNIETALEWWCDLPDKWTPVGWKDHLFRFNIMFNGAITAQPDVSARTAKWAGQGVQLLVCPSTENTRPYQSGLWHDDNSVVQGWIDCAAPVLYSDWAADGLILRQEVFGHIPGAKDVESGVEPLFLWVRYSVQDRVEELPLPEKYGMRLQINAPCIKHSMNARNNTILIPDRARYPRDLTPEAEVYNPADGWRLLEDGGKVRLAVAPKQECEATFDPCKPEERDSSLYISMSTKKGTRVDVLVPMLPTDRELFDKELALGYDGALAEANAYWGRIPATAARFQVPEDYVNRAIEWSLKLSEIIAEKNPADGNYSMLLGSWHYDVLWATPVSMTSVMLLDTMGYHSAAEKYMEFLRKEQGTVKPPGDHYPQHPGYLATPKSLTAINWLSDHGAILWAASEHALLSGDKAFIEKWTPNIVKACEFIKEARAITNHGGIKGILPPAVATDSGTQIQAAWNDGWAYKGLITAVRMLKKIDHPRAAEFEAEAKEYKKTYVQAFREKAKSMPAWTDKTGKKHRLAPTALFGDQEWETRFPFYLDTGPLFLVFSGLMDADDELMKSTLLWFREGPQTRFYRYDSNWWQVPSLHHEISSCEPIYSFNVFHSWQSGDRMKFLEGMYSLFTGYISQQTYTMCEHRGGVMSLSPALVPGYMARFAVIDDQIKEGELHLLRIIPLAWLKSDKESKFENIPTEFGPVSLKTRLAAGGKELQVSFSPKFRKKPTRVVLHVPPVKGLAKITLNGKEVEWDGKKKALEIR
ncbi:MAG: hypothetical protein Q7N50_08420 [Armatimonadota bacterium]|nr:hypothetical protein [Armatimonadota bacterium]